MSRDLQKSLSQPSVPVRVEGEGAATAGDRRWHVQLRDRRKAEWFEPKGIDHGRYVALIFNTNVNEHENPKWRLPSGRIAAQHVLGVAQDFSDKFRSLRPQESDFGLTQGDQCRLLPKKLKIPPAEARKKAHHRNQA